MDKISVFKNSEFGEIKTFLIEDEVWIAGSDVARVLNYENPQKAIRDHVDEEDRMQVKLSDIQEVNDSFLPPHMKGSKITIINESGLYSLILRSNLPKAKEFKRWITKEVLPAIRKTGSYITKEKEYEIREDERNKVLVEMVPRITNETLKSILPTITESISNAATETAKCMMKEVMLTMATVVKETVKSELSSINIKGNTTVEVINNDKHIELDMDSLKYFSKFAYDEIIDVEELVMILLKNNIVYNRGKKIRPRERYMRKDTKYFDYKNELSPDGIMKQYFFITEKGGKFISSIIINNNEE